MSRTVVGLDIGTNYIKVAIGEEDPLSGEMNIIGCSKCVSRGIKNGNIINLEDASASIQNAVDIAEQDAGAMVTDVYTVIGGNQAVSKNSKGQICVNPYGKASPCLITEEARLRAIENSKQIYSPLDLTLIHVTPQEYIVDDQSGIKNPVGMSGVRLEAMCNLVYANQNTFSNLARSIDRAGYRMIGVALKSLASNVSTCLDEENELGSIIIDLGAGSTDFMVLNKGAPVYASSIPIGQNLVTQDISVMKNIPMEVAEDIKLKYGATWLFGNEQNEGVIIPSVGNHGPEQTTRLEIVEIIAPRLQEIFTTIRAEIVRKSGLKKLNGCIVLTGGGAHLRGVEQMAKVVFGTESVRIGHSKDMGGKNKMYMDSDFATAVGLVLINSKNSVPKEKVTAPAFKEKIEKKSSGEKVKKEKSPSDFLNILKKFM